MTPKSLARLTTAIANLQSAKRWARDGQNDLALMAVQRALQAAEQAQRELTPRTLIEVFSNDDAHVAG